MDVSEITQIWGAVTGALDLESLISAWRTFSEQLSNETIKEDAALLTELVLLSQPVSTVDVLEASFSSHGAPLAAPPSQLSFQQHTVLNHRIYVNGVDYGQT